MKHSSQDLFRGLALAAFVAVLWGVLGYGLKAAFVFSDPATVSWFRFTFSFCALGLISLFRTPETFKELPKVPWWMILAAGGLALNYLGYAKGVHLTTPGNSQLLSQIGPLLVVVFGILILRERLNRIQIMGVLVAASGFYVFYLDQLKFFLNSIETYHLGNTWILAGSVSWAFWALAQKIAHRRGHQGRTLNLFVYGWCSVILFSFAQLESLHHLTWQQWGLMILLGMNTLVAYGGLALATEKAPMTLVNLVIATNPLLALLISPDPLDTGGWLGAFMVLAGVALTLYRRGFQARVKA